MNSTNPITPTPNVPNVAEIINDIPQSKDLDTQEQIDFIIESYDADPKDLETAATKIIDLALESYKGSDADKVREYMLKLKTSYLEGLHPILNLKEFSVLVSRYSKFPEDVVNFLGKNEKQSTFSGNLTENFHPDQENAALEAMKKQSPELFEVLKKIIQQQNANLFRMKVTVLSEDIAERIQLKTEKYKIYTDTNTVLESITNLTLDLFVAHRNRTISTADYTTILNLLETAKSNLIEAFKGSMFDYESTRKHYEVFTDDNLEKALGQIFVTYNKDDVKQVKDKTLIYEVFNMSHKLDPDQREELDDKGIKVKKTLRFLPINLRQELFNYINLYQNKGTETTYLSEYDVKRIFNKYSKQIVNAKPPFHYSQTDIDNIVTTFHKVLKDSKPFPKKKEQQQLAA